MFPNRISQKEVSQQFGLFESMMRSWCGNTELFCKSEKSRSYIFLDVRYMMVSNSLRML